uniref:G protein-coupled receptor n=1 Tax=Caenorhabditis tropicalis TaxID=1561998 RepID=A0A1I7UWQ4_9PELO
MVPILSVPSYLLAWLLITRNKSKVVQAVKKKYIRQMIINFLSVILLCVVVCPVLIPPIPGYFMMGLMAYDDSNVALPLVVMTHMVLMVAFAIMQLFKHQLVTLSDVRYTKKFELPVKIIRWSYILCYVLLAIVAISILPTLTIEFDLEGFRRGAFEYFKSPICLCSDMFIADPRHWKIYIPYFLSISFGGLCSVTGVSSVITCLVIVYDSRKMVSRDTLIMQRNFTFILMYQALVCIFLIIMPLVSVSTLFYADISISEHGLYYLLIISSQGAVNNMMHIVPGLWRKLRKKKSVGQSRQSWKGSAMWSTSHVASTPS